ncbi:hypothetical protein LguiA_008683 [Lonicera macranthoides]
MAIATRQPSFTTSSPQNQHMCNLTTSTDFWHCRFGHTLSPCLSFIDKNFLHFPIVKNNVCPTCPLAKQSRFPFSSSTISTSHPFEIIHCDI